MLVYNFMWIFIVFFYDVYMKKNLLYYVFF